ncbi:uncharacterized protein K02A2.6-like [Teleopsis dalmanni]|uniref:uncharacterized protein K02A2.6-like n=1 Tax=Teleopsis dalmanni TaxID=139649 RepID=UPI0018CEA481|nr:uncharacterized protein K02A2.6-like [Teleopsis dalmanni]
MKLLAATNVFWPNINLDIEHVVKTCDTCATASKSPMKCTTQQWKIPSAPWKRIYFDYAGPIDGNYFLVIIDAFSKWPEIFKTLTTTAAKTIEFIEKAFAQHGLCDMIVSDNAPQFISQEFKNFCDFLVINHISTAPYSLQSNGQAERFVDLLKSGLKKAKEAQRIPHLLSIHTILQSRYEIPSELLNGRKMKIRLDCIKQQKPEGELEKQIPEFTHTVEPVIVPDRTYVPKEILSPAIEQQTYSNDDVISNQEISTITRYKELRRSQRATKGHAPRWHQDYQQY